ncbi:MAG: hypothetical protein ACD_79C00287G0028 [uncultured bacterium]|nr:MAG: hypothetical protein ACD_79C00287G0028 [uncultured bacterium]
MKKTIIFRVDCGKVWGISMGHILRAFTLARELKKKYNIVFVSKNYPDAISFIKTHYKNVIAIPQEDDSDKTLIKISNQFKPKIVIFDLNKTPYMEFFDYSQKAKIKTVVFDIDGKINGDPDIIINDWDINKTINYYKQRENTKILRGTKYFILADKIRRKPLKQKVKNILITMGGSDPSGLTIKIVSSLAKYLKDYKVSVVLGPLFKNRNNVINAVKNYDFMEILNSPNNFLKTINKYDIIICAGGRTLLECAYLGKPVIAVASIDHEKIVIDEITKITNSINVGKWHSGKSTQIILKGIDDFACNKSYRDEIYKNSKKLIDGKAIDRMIRIINKSSFN